MVGTRSTGAGACPCDIIKCIHAHYKLRAPAEQRETIERVHGFHQEKCPVARSLEGAIHITTSYEIVP
jgi:uncharacterized OsmC-like protein